MEKLPKETIISIANGILSESDFLAQHGTSLANATSIMNTGFNYDKTSMAIVKPNILSLCSYGWKENAPGDCANVILSIPKSFIKQAYNLDDESYQSYVNWTKEKKNQEIMFDTVSTVVEKKEGPSERKEGKYTFPALMQYIKRNIPREFIRGCFIYCDNTNYLYFLSNKEESLNHLTYVDNPYFYENLSYDDQMEFVRKFRDNPQHKI